MSTLNRNFDANGRLLPAPVSDGQKPAEMLVRSTPLRAPLPAPLARPPRPSDLTLHRERDELLTAFGKATLTDRYLMPGEGLGPVRRVALPTPRRRPRPAPTTRSRLWFIRRRRSSRTAAPPRGCHLLLSTPCRTRSKIVRPGTGTSSRFQRRWHRHLGAGCVRSAKYQGLRRDLGHHPFIRMWVGHARQPGFAVAVPPPSTGRAPSRSRVPQIARRPNFNTRDSTFTTVSPSPMRSWACPGAPFGVRSRDRRGRTRDRRRQLGSASETRLQT